MLERALAMSSILVFLHRTLLLKDASRLQDQDRSEGLCSGARLETWLLSRFKGCDFTAIWGFLARAFLKNKTGITFL